jgi:DnaJ-class molecular chaperone
MPLFNLPSGTDPKDISDPDECPTCGGSGEIPMDQEVAENPDSMETCPDCSGLGVKNKRTKE